MPLLLLHILHSQSDTSPHCAASKVDRLGLSCGLVVDFCVFRLADFTPLCHG